MTDTEKQIKLSTRIKKKKREPSENDNIRRKKKGSPKTI